MQVADFKEQLENLQSSTEGQRKAEITAAHDLLEADAMLREFDRDLEVHCVALWREVSPEIAGAISSVCVALRQAR